MPRLAAQLDSGDNTEPTEIISEYFQRINAQEEPIDLIEDVVNAIFNEGNNLKHREFHLASLLYSNRTPSVEFIVTLIRAVLSIDGFLDKTKISLFPKQNRKIVSVAGSGKKGIKTINISTPAAILASSLDAQIVKHASKATSSISGSSDFFIEVGGEILDIQGSIDVFNKTGFGLFSIEGLVPRFDNLYGGRVLVPTSLSYGLPAAISPIKTDTVLYGFSMPRIKESVLTLHALGFKDVIVTNSTDDGVKYIDEAGLFKTNYIAHSRSSGKNAGLSLIDPANILGFTERHSISSIGQKENKEANVREAANILRGKGNKVQQEIIALNAALILVLSGVFEDLEESYMRARDELSSTRSFDKLVEIIEASGGKLNENI